MEVIINSNSDTVITGSAYDDTIENSGNNVSINCGAGDDYIANHIKGVNVTIEGGAGNDSIFKWSGMGFVYVYHAGDGDDYISNFSLDDTLVIPDADYTMEKSGSNVLVHVGENTITLSGAANLLQVNIVKSLDYIIPVNIISNDESNVTITGKEHTPNYISNHAAFVTINGGNNVNAVENGDWKNPNSNNVLINCGASNDRVTNCGSNVTIKGGDGDDYLYNEGGLSVTIDCGEGNDTVISSGNNISVKGDAGDDFLQVEGSNVTIDGGAGSDTIFSGGFNGSIIAVNGG